MEENKKSKKKIALLIGLLIAAVIVVLLCIKGCSKQTFEITFKDYDGTVLETQQVEKGEVPVFNGDLERKPDDTYEYTFVSWDKEIVKATKDEVYTAIYTTSLLNNEKKDEEIAYFVITFLDDDGLVLKSSSYKYGAIPSCLAPNKTVGNYKYTFKSWSPTISKVTGNKTYTATYEKTAINSRVIYIDNTGLINEESIPSGTTISFSAGDHGIYTTAPSPITLIGNQTVDLTSDTYKPIANSGYLFKGYTYDSGTRTFTAFYVATYTVTFDVQSHGTAPDTQSIAVGEKAIKPTDPSEANITFAGWYKEAACTNAWDFDTDTVSVNTTLYAKWTADATFNVQSHGTAPDTQTIIVGGKATKPTDPTCTGYVFRGWYKEAACTNAWDFDTDTVSVNTTLYAKWYSELGGKIANAKTIYSNGEYACKNDSANSVISINGINCYVLQVDTTNDKAQLITQNLYGTKFNTTSKGEASEYNYSTSSLKTWMDDFYTNNLESGDISGTKGGADYTILETTATYYYNDTIQDNPDPGSISSGSISQKVFALDAIEARSKANKFGSFGGSGFWISCAFKTANGPDGSKAYYITNTGGCSRTTVNNSMVSARPSFWISLK